MTEALETCERARGGAAGYRAGHWREPGQIFPMHKRCNANYDLVPGWVNPALVVFLALWAVCLTGFIVNLRRAAVERSRPARDGDQG